MYYMERIIFFNARTLRLSHDWMQVLKVAPYICFHYSHMSDVEDRDKVKCQNIFSYTQLNGSIYNYHVVHTLLRAQENAVAYTVSYYRVLVTV